MVTPTSKRKKATRARKATSASTRDLAPPELRYQLLRAGPGRSAWALRGIAGGFGLAGAAALAIATATPKLLVVMPVLTAVAHVAVRKVSRLLGPSGGLRAVPVGIVPWGIVVDPDGQPEPVPWSRLREVSYTLLQRDNRRDADSPSLAVMLFDTDVGLVQAEAEEGEWVTSVDAFAAPFARAAARTVAADLAGREPLDTGGAPATLALLRRAEALLDSADGRAALSLDAGGYRTTSSRIAGPETRATLRAALWNGDIGCDPGPLAAVLAADLAISELLPDLLRLILSPSPLLAATARAAAVRLGASRMAAGSLDELEHFLAAEELTELRRWAGVAEG